MHMKRRLGRKRPASLMMVVFYFGIRGLLCCSSCLLALSLRLPVVGQNLGWDAVPTSLNHPMRMSPFIQIVEYPIDIRNTDHGWGFPLPRRNLVIILCVYHAVPNLINPAYHHPRSSQGLLASQRSFLELPGHVPLVNSPEQVMRTRTTMPRRTFSPPSFSSTASSRTIFRKT
jgi:hypothetical protein